MRRTISEGVKSFAKQKKLGGGADGDVSCTLNFPFRLLPMDYSPWGSKNRMK